MPDPLKKALLGAVVGALLVVFYTHVSDERAKRDPAAQAARPAQNALGEITGAFTPDDLLERIFSTFCIGK